MAEHPNAEFARLKGLGEMDAEELWETTMDPDTRTLLQVTVEQAAIAESAGEGIAQDIYEMFTRAVQLRTEVQINDAAINAVHTNFR